MWQRHAVEERIKIRKGKDQTALVDLWKKPFIRIECQLIKNASIAKR